jgi:hypothetical protein
LCYHGIRGVGSDDLGEGGRELAGYEAVPTPEVEEEGGGRLMVGEHGFEECGWVGGAEGGVGEGVEGAFTWRCMLACCSAYG